MGFVTLFTVMPFLIQRVCFELSTNARSHLCTSNFLRNSYPLVLLGSIEGDSYDANISSCWQEGTCTCNWNKTHGGLNKRHLCLIWVFFDKYFLHSFSVSYRVEPCIPWICLLCSTVLCCLDDVERVWPPAIEMAYCEQQGTTFLVQLLDSCLLKIHSFLLCQRITFGVTSLSTHLLIVSWFLLV